MSKKSTNDALRAQYVNNLMEALSAVGEEVLRVESNKIAIPVVDAEGEDSWVVFTVVVPTGSRDGEIYDGYSMARDYEMRTEEKQRKVAEAAEAKARKIARDEEMRRQKAAARAARGGKQ